MTTPDTRAVALGDLTLHTVDAGRGEPIVLLHGFPLDHTMWRGQIEHLAQRWRVIAPDLRGFGRSQVVPGTSSMALMADDVDRLLSALGISRPVVLAGLSMGGYVAWQFCQRHAGRLRALVACDTRAIADSAEQRAARMKLIDALGRHGPEVVAEAMLPKLFAPVTLQAQPELVAATRATILATAADGMAAALRGLAERPDVTAHLPAISVPALVVVGEHDAISAPEEMRAIAAAISGARFEVIAGAGHMAPLEQPAAFNRVLDDYLARV